MNELTREEWNAAAVVILTKDPYKWPLNEAENFIKGSDFDESYNEGQTPEETIRNDSYYWELEQ